MNRELEEALKELALEIAQCYATIEQQKAVMRQALDALETHVPYYIVRSEYPPIVALRNSLEGKQ